MNPKLISHIKAITPPLNPVTANGIVVEHMKQAEQYIHDVILAIAEGFPPGFKYLGCERATPIEEYAEITRVRESKRNYDLARHDRYMMRYTFEYNGIKYSKLISLPFVGTAGIMHIRGTRYAVSPVLSDRIISVDPNSKVFVRLLRTKLIFDRAPQYYIANDARETVQVVRSEIYNHSSAGKMSKPVIKADTVLVFYLLCRYGLREMFQRFTKVNPIIITDEEYQQTKDKYPHSKYVVCRTMGIKPVTFKDKSVDYEPTSIVLIFKQADYQKPAIRALVAGFYYIADHFPFEMTVDYVDSTDKWKVMMGQVLWSSDITHGRLLSDVSEHITGLDWYIDKIMEKKFAMIGMPIKDIYELFFIIIERFNEWLINSVNNVSSVYNKEITILNFFLTDITTMFVKFYFKIIKDAQSPKGLTDKNIQSAMAKCLYTDDIINKLVAKHGELSVVNNSCDNRVFKITQSIVPQDKTTKGRKTNDKPSLHDRSRFLDVSIAEVCTHTSMSKAEPTGWTRLNLHLNVAKDGSIVRNPELKPMLDAIQQEIARRN